MERTVFRAAAIAAAVTFLGSPTRAQEAPCGTHVTRANLIPCALRASLAVKAQRDELDAARGRQIAVSPLLPSNPTLSLSASRRSEGGREATNWYATLSQELEIAGQRGLRRDSAEANVESQRKRVLLSEREAAARALGAFFDALAAREEQELALRLTAVTKAVAVVAHAKSDKGLIAPVDADVADAGALRAERNRLSAERHLASAHALLATLLGMDPAVAKVEVDGELTPLSSADEYARSASAADQSQRPELQALDAQRRSMELRASAFRRSRVPNPTLSAFAQNDGFNERVLGLGIAFPIPIPGNVGRTYNGEVAESEALARRAATDRERAKREIRLAIATAAQAFESRRRELEAFSPELVRNAETSLRALGQEVESGRLTVREAVIAQQSLIELLQTYVAARLELGLASVDLALAAGVPLERGAR